MGDSGNARLDAISTAPVASSPPDDGREERLVAAAVAGDAAAFAALYDLHLDRVYRYGYYRTGNRPDAEDLAQQTFLLAWRAIRRYRPGRAPFAAWLLAISHNVAASHFRGPRAAATLDPAARAAAGADPAAALEASAAREGVRRALLRLRPDHQRVVLLRFIGGCSVAEVAAATGKTENHVRVTQHRALARLRRLLAERAPAPRPGERPALARLGRAVAASGDLISTALPRSLH
jgi:RNA polymerase sigma-70 factor, ECF subfamily